MKEILPGLTPEGASLLLSMAQRGLQAVIAELQAAGGALDAAVTDAKTPDPEPIQPTE